MLPNPAPTIPALLPREQLRSAFDLDGPTLAFAGRLTAQKSLGVALRALAATEGVALVIAGDGDEREPLERLVAELGLGARVRFLGAQPRERVVELFRAADASILSSSWENFPHTVVEALAVGTPVLATRAEASPRSCTTEATDCSSPPGEQGLAAAIRRYVEDDALRERLRAAAAQSVADYAPERVFARLEETLIRTLAR